MWISTTERCREFEYRIEHEFGMPTSFLVEKAGVALFDAVKETLPEGGKLTVLCGRGLNGADGFVVARLAQTAGYHIECLVASPEEELMELASDQMRIAKAAGVVSIFCTDPRYKCKLDCLGNRELIVDGLLGTGAKNAVQGPIKDAIQAINRSGVPVIAIDVPSGIDPNTGEELGESVWALRTVTMGPPKPFLFEGIGLEHAGHWTVADIGIPQVLLNEPTEARLLEKEWISHFIPERLRRSHKGDCGSVLVVAGSTNMPGAAIMACTSALRSGAGLVTIASIPSVCHLVASYLPEIILMPLPEKDGAIDPSAADLLLEAQPRFQSAVFGPGMTHGANIEALLSKVWKSWHLPCVIDADALTVVSQGVEPPKNECVLTPHPGEMGRLMKASIAEIQADRFKTVRAAAQGLNRCIVLKGAHSLICEPEQPVLVNQTGNSGMASAGMGDVLSGIIATLLAQDLPAYYAAACGVFWHGESGDICAQEIGEIGFTAMEVANCLPRARAKITSV